MSGREGLPASARGVEAGFAELSPLQQTPAPSWARPGAPVKWRIGAEAGGIGGPCLRGIPYGPGRMGRGQPARAWARARVKLDLHLRPPALASPRLDAFSGGRGWGSAVRVFIPAAPVQK